jgi:chromosome partitioning protein
MSTIAITNQKGGVGKTTTAINIATALAATGKKTLLIDLDPQGNASTGVGVDLKDRHSTLYDLLVRNAKIEDIIYNTKIPKLSLIPATIDLAAVEIELSHLTSKELYLKNKLSNIANNYDYIIIDCPPSLGLLTINALTFADYLIIPLQCEFFALEGLVHLMNTTNLIKKKLNPSLEIAGIVLTMIDKRNRLTSLVEQDVRSTFKELVFQTIIPRNIKLSEAPSHGKPALIYDNRCLGSVAYMLLAKEILSKLESTNNIDENTDETYEFRKASSW